MNVVFVCTGNMCRSPMAEGLFNKLMRENGVYGITCSSAGLATHDGSSATTNAVVAARELGVDISAHTSRMMTRSILRKADLVVCMTKKQYEMLNAILPEEKIYLLGGGIADPYNQDLDVYRKCAKKIERSLPALLEEILSKGI